jgi:hypothetical protein
MLLDPTDHAEAFGDDGRTSVLSNEKTAKGSSQGPIEEVEMRIKGALTLSPA